MTHRGSDEGSTLPLVAFFAALSLLLVLLVVAATSLYLERKRLFTLADGAALVSAESFELESVTRTPSGYRPVLTTEQVAVAAEEYLAAFPADTFNGLRLVRAESIDGRSATVTLSSQWSPPVVTLFVPEGVRIEVTVRARSVFS